MNDIIKVNNVSFEYVTEESAFKAIDNLSLDVKEGEFVVIIGHNGSGKSTLSKNLNAILTPTSGEIYINGLNTNQEENLWDIRQTAGMVFQNPDNQIVATIVEEDVAFGPENLGIEPSEIRTRVEESLKSVGMYELRDRQPHLLSGGQKQRVAIAGIIAMKPKCIIFDEATAMLDPSGRKEVMNTIKTLNKEENITVLHITHFMEEALEADRIIVLKEGRVLADRNPKELFSDRELIDEAGLDLPPVIKLREKLGMDKDVMSAEDIASEIA